MPRPKSSPTYCIHARSQRAYTTVDGRQIQLGAANSPESRDVFDRVLAEWYANGRKLPQASSAAKGAPRVGPTVAMLLERFWTHAVTYYRQPALDGNGMPMVDADGSQIMVPGTELDNYRQIIRITRRLYGDIQASNFACPELEAVRGVMIRAKIDPETGERSMGWTRVSTNRQIGRLKHIFAWGVTKGLVPVTVHQTLCLLPGLRAGKTAAAESSKVRPVAEARALAILPHIAPPVAAMVRVQLLTGMRSTEVCIMRPCDIDRTVTPWVYTPRFHKTQHHGIERKIPIGKQAREVLVPFLEREQDAYCFSPQEGNADRQRRRREARKTKVQPSQIRRAEEAKRQKRKIVTRDRYNKSSYYLAVRYGCEKAFGMPAEYRTTQADRTLPTDSPEVAADKKKTRLAKWALRAKWHKQNAWHPHQARHRAATDLRKAGSLDVAKVVLGHTSIKMTQLYAEADVAAAHEVIERIG